MSNRDTVNWNLVHVCYDGVVEVNAIRLLLEGEGFHFTIWDELANSGYSETLQNTTGVRIMVQDDQAQKAYELLKEKGYIKEAAADSFIDKVVQANPLDSRNKLINYGIIIFLILIVVVGSIALAFQ